MPNSYGYLPKHIFFYFDESNFGRVFTDIILFLFVNFIQKYVRFYIFTIVVSVINSQKKDL